MTLEEVQADWEEVEQLLESAERAQPSPAVVSKRGFFNLDSLRFSFS